jgi:large subunit ribosomal protein L6
VLEAKCSAQFFNRSYFEELKAMSRIAKNPVEVPAGVDTKLVGQELVVKGSKGSLTLFLSQHVELKKNENKLVLCPREPGKRSLSLAGTMRSLVNNMIIGVTQGFEKKLVLSGVGYRAKATGKVVNLTLGFSHTIDYELPEGVTAQTPSQSEILLTSADKQLLGQVASEIRAFRPPEPYKGKGVCYNDERVYRKEAKKK